MKPLRVLVYSPDPIQTQEWSSELSKQSVARGLPLQFCPLLNEEGDVEAAKLDRAAAADYAIGWKPYPAFFSQHPKLKAFFNAGAGVDYFLNNPAVASQIPAQLPIIRLEDAGMAQQMIDYCRHQVLDWMYRNPQYREQQKNQLWIEHPAPRRANFPIGVFGLGVLGSTLAKAFAADGFKVFGHASTPKQIEGVHFEPNFEKFLAASKVLILLAPATAQTHQVMCAKTFAQLPKGALLLNVARGALVHETDLLRALDSSQLGGACLDVFEQEPLPAANPLWSHPLVRITPHSSAATLIDLAAEQILAKIAAHAAGQTVSGKIDMQRGY